MINNQHSLKRSIEFTFGPSEVWHFGDTAPCGFESTWWTDLKLQILAYSSFLQLSYHVAESCLCQVCCLLHGMLILRYTLSHHHKQWILNWPEYIQKSCLLTQCTIFQTQHNELCDCRHVWLEYRRWHNRLCPSSLSIQMMYVLFLLVCIVIWIRSIVDMVPLQYRWAKMFHMSGCQPFVFYTPDSFFVQICTQFQCDWFDFDLIQLVNVKNKNHDILRSLAMMDFHGNATFNHKSKTIVNTIVL
jgi:hypothetical protein